jgi:hypothetical protein
LLFSFTLRTSLIAHCSSTLGLNHVRIYNSLPKKGPEQSDYSKKHFF